MPAEPIEEDRQRTQELARNYLTLLGQGRLDEWIDLWHPEGVLEFPYAPAGQPSTYHGKAEILAYMQAASGRIATDGVDEMRIHESTDAGVLIVELATHGHLVATAAAFEQRYVFMFETRDGLLWRYREYWNPLVLIDAHGSYEQWIASRSGQPDMETGPPDTQPPGRPAPPPHEPTET